MRNNGPTGRHAGETINTPRGEELRAWDQLGPLTRTILNQSHYPGSAVAVLRRYGRFGANTPDRDAAIAAELAAIDKKRLELDRANGLTTDFIPPSKGRTT